MNLGVNARKLLHFLAIAAATLTILTGTTAATAQEDAAPTEAVAAEAGIVPDAAPAFELSGPDMINGQPTPGAMGFQEQFSPNGHYALWFHDAILLPIIAVNSLFVLFLLLFVIAKYNKRANPVPSKTSHNTLLEVIWTGLPILILLFIAVPSITLLARQFESAPEEALTIKVNGYQWYWGYEYVDNGGFEVVSNMKDEAEAAAEGYPPQLAVDNRMVVPVGEPIRIQTFGADVIHSFGIPSLWFKLDAVPGRINEKVLEIEEPGIYYGQCMELCGARHGFMPIAIEARPRDEYEAWVLSQPGGTLASAEDAAPAVEDAADTTEEAAPAEGEATETEEVAAEA